MTFLALSQDPCIWTHTRKYQSIIGNISKIHLLPHPANQNPWPQQWVGLIFMHLNLNLWNPRNIPQDPMQWLQVRSLQQHGPQKNSMRQKIVNRTQVMTPLTKLQVPCTSTHVATGSPALLTCVQRLYGNTQQTWAYAKTPHSSRAGQMWTQPAQQEIRLKVLQSSLNFRGKMRHFKHTHTKSFWNCPS